MTEIKHHRWASETSAALNLAKTLTYLALAFAFFEFGLNMPSVGRIFESYANMSRLQSDELARIATHADNLTSALSDAALIYAAKASAAEKIIPAKNADQIVDSATDRLAKLSGKDWEVIIRGVAAKLDDLSPRSFGR